MASRSTSSPQYYRLYIVKNFKPGREVNESRGTIYWVFCQSRNDSTMKVVKWFYGAWYHSGWFDDHEACLHHEDTESAFQGLVDGRHIKDKDSAVVKALEITLEDQNKLKAEWDKFADTMVKNQQEQNWEPGQISDAELKKCISLEFCATWQMNYLHDQARERTESLLGKRLLIK
ncbi:hypothetical protein PWT90_02354 [Aphanocladium album]|nr:hypothetical protein PWT90_02354 [Aphanocladium album]